MINYNMFIFNICICRLITGYRFDWCQGGNILVLRWIGLHYGKMQLMNGVIPQLL